jgi:formylglycine-generating enzyme required for sulfatase activity
MIGNVWEWTSDWWETKHVVHEHYEVVTEVISVVINSEGLIEEREVSFVSNPNGPGSGTDKVID